jgi:hypothetical protein
LFDAGTACGVQVMIQPGWMSTALAMIRVGISPNKSNHEQERRSAL